MNYSKLKKHLTRLQSEFDVSGQIENDPIGLVKKYTSPEDQEVTGLIAASLAYGGVSQIRTSIKKVLEAVGPNPAHTIREKDGTYWKKQIPRDFRHRWTSNEDIGILLTWMGFALRSHGSLENFFVQKGQSFEEHLNYFCDHMMNFPISPFGVDHKAWYFFPKPANKSACKRLLLYLRWMAGTGPMALGIWDRVPPSDLVIPLDTHVLRISRNLGITSRKDASWKTAMEITDKLKKLDPKDPTHFDFALCHLGISQKCPSRFNQEVCHTCEMNSLCIRYPKRKNTKQK